jgi:molybdate transport repressor ModE-like protein
VKHILTSGADAWLELEGQYIFGRKEAEILEQIQRQGSFMRASKTLGISYAHAWNTIDRIQKALKTPLVEARRGGTAGGGSAELTDYGVELLNRYRSLQERLRTTVSGSTSPKGEKQPFQKNTVIPDLTVIGSNSVGIGLAIEEMLLERKFTYEVVNVGSSGGLNAIMLGEADIAGIHLADPVTGEYNVPFLRRYWLDDRAVLIRGYRRTQGLIVRNGNPKEISGFEDLLRPDVKIVNRRLGSGTRQILDANLRRISEERQIDMKEICKRIRGYDHELDSHLEVSEAVERGEADVGIGVEVRTIRNHIDFIPIHDEWFDFAIDESRLKKPLVQLFLTTLRSKKIWDIGKTRAPEIRFTEETGKIIYHQ